MKKILVLFLIFIITSIFFLPIMLHNYQFQKSSDVQMNQRWTYSWGKEEVPTEKSNWQRWNFSLGTDGGHHASPYLWLKTKLPEGDWENPVIYFYGILANELDVYLDDKHIYHSKETDNSMGNDFFRKLVVPLNDQWKNETIYLRLHCTKNKQYLGIYGPIFMGNHKDILARIFKYEFDHAILGFFFFIFALVMLAVSFFVKESRQKKALFSLIAFSICTGGWNLGEYDNIDLILFYSPYWAYLDTISVLFSPIAGFYFFEQIFGEGPKKIIRRILQFHILYVLPYLVAIAIDTNLSNIKIYNFLSIFYSWEVIRIILIIYALAALSVVYQRIREKDNLDIKMFSVGLFILALSIFYVDNNWTDWGIFCFIVSLILVLGHRFVRNIETITAFSEELQAKNLILNQWNEALEQTVADRTASLSNLLNNAGQGFLTFGEDLIINGEYSEECTKIFCKDIKETKITDLLFAEDEEQKNFLGAVFEKLLKQQDEDLRNKYLPLLPDELKVGQKHISINYRIIEDSKHPSSQDFMLIITDITDKRILESKIEEERKTLKMVVRCVVNHDDFQAAIKDYQNFCLYELDRLMDDKQWVGEILNKVFRIIHTFKGTFSQLEMVNIVEKLHRFESELLSIKEIQDGISNAWLRDFVLNCSLEDWLEKDLTVLKNTLGENYFNQQEVLLVEKTSLLRLEKKMLSLLSPMECRELLPDVRQLRFKPFKNIVQSYAEYLENLAERTGKLIGPLIIEGEDILVDLDQYHEFAKSLVHIFRNIVDHGIEWEEERIDNGKPGYGTVRCQIENDEKNIYLTISDDGRGIDFERIKEKALSQGFCPVEELEKLKEQELLDLIFSDGFSIKDEVDDISGRGIGIPAVKMETERLGGRLTVATKKGEGTSFTFTLPLEKINDIPTITPMAMLNNLLGVTMNYIQDSTGKSAIPSASGKIHKTERIQLNTFSAFMSFNGVMRYRLIMSLDEELLNLLMRDFLIEEIDSKDELGYMEDVLAEILNIVLGNGLVLLGEVGELIRFESPITIVCAKGASIKYTQWDVWSSVLEYPEGSLRITLVTDDQCSI